MLIKRRQIWVVIVGSLLYLIILMAALAYVQASHKPYVNPHPINCLTVEYPERYEVCTHPM